MNWAVGEARGSASGVFAQAGDHTLRERVEMKRVKRTGLGPPRPGGVT